MTHCKPASVANHFLFGNERVRVWQMDLAPGEASVSRVRFREILIELKG